MKRKNRYVTALVLIAFVVLWGVREMHPSEPVRVSTGSITRGNIERRIVATGTLQAVSTVQVGTQVSGTVQSLHADFNSIVHAGEVIATLDPAIFNAELGEAEANLGEARAAEAQAEADEAGIQAAVGDARTKLSRAETLAADELIPLADLDSARTTMGELSTELLSGDSKVVEAKAAVQQAEAAVGQARINADHTIIRSPIDGIVIARSVDVGQTVAASVQAPVLFTIAADPKTLQVAVDVDEAEIGGIGTGQRATFTVDSYPGTVFEGDVTQIRIQPATTDAVVTYTMIVSVANPDEKLRPGMTAIVTCPGPRVENKVRLPNGALAFRPSEDVLRAMGQTSEVASGEFEALTEPTHRRVWRFDGHAFVPVDVRVGLADTQWTELVSGPLEPGDPVVTSASANH